MDEKAIEPPGIQTGRRRLGTVRVSRDVHVDDRRLPCLRRDRGDACQVHRLGPRDVMVTAGRLTHRECGEGARHVVARHQGDPAIRCREPQQPGRARLGEPGLEELDVERSPGERARDAGGQKQILGEPVDHGVAERGRHVGVNAAQRRDMADALSRHGGDNVAVVQQHPCIGPVTGHEDQSVHALQRRTQRRMDRRSRRRRPPPAAATPRQAASSWSSPRRPRRPGPRATARPAHPGCPPPRSPRCASLPPSPCRQSYNRRRPRAAAAQKERDRTADGQGSPRHTARWLGYTETGPPSARQITQGSAVARRGAEHFCKRLLAIVSKVGAR